VSARYRCHGSQGSAPRTSAKLIAGLEAERGDPPTRGPVAARSPKTFFATGVLAKKLPLPPELVWDSDLLVQDESRAVAVIAMTWPSGRVAIHAVIPTARCRARRRRSFVTDARIADPDERGLGLRASIL